MAGRWFGGSPLWMTGTPVTVAATVVAEPTVPMGLSVAGTSFGDTKEDVCCMYRPCPPRNSYDG
jgi:hypothetical protein